MTTPANRCKQMRELLDVINGIHHPVIVARDMKWRAEEGATRGIEYGTPFGWAYDLSFGVIGTVRKIDADRPQRSTAR
jgi:hypothetical protein